MKWLLVALLLFPASAWASVSGIDDAGTNLTPGEEQRLDNAITTYYQHPSRQKVETVLELMNGSEMLRKKSAWAPTIGFLSVVFADNKKYLFDWMSLYDYNQYAQSVFVAALVHARLKETALVFAQAHQWPQRDLQRLKTLYDTVDLKHLIIRFPSHIDTLWGAFFASGDPVYINEIIDVVFQEKPSDLVHTGSQTPPATMLLENKKLAESTLRRYAPLYPPVEDAIDARIAAEKDEHKKAYLIGFVEHIQHVAKEDHPAEESHTTAALGVLAGISVLLAGLWIWRRKGKAA